MSTGGTSARAKGVQTPSSSKSGKGVQTPDVSKLNLQSPIKIPVLPKASIEISEGAQAKVLSEAIKGKEGSSKVREQPKRSAKLPKIDYAEEEVDDEESSSFSDESGTDGGESPKITYDSAMATLEEAGTSKPSTTPKKQVTPVKQNVVKKGDRVPN